MNRDGSRGRRLLCGVLLVVSVAIHDLAAGAESFKPFKLKTLEGAERSLAQVLGKATLVVFFYPTCKYCNASFPEVQKLHDAYKNRGLSVVWINVVPEEARLIADWQTKNGYTVPVLVGGRSIVNEYKVAITPTHYLLDAQGKVLSKKAGYNSGDEKDLESAIQDALGR